MNTINQTDIFSSWLLHLSDRAAKVNITRRIERAALGNFGDHHHVDGPIWEMRMDIGPGYRVYYAQEGLTIYLLICGGAKKSQQSDIELAKEIWRVIHG